MNILSISRRPPSTQDATDRRGIKPCCYLLLSIELQVLEISLWSIRLTCCPSLSLYRYSPHFLHNFDHAAGVHFRSIIHEHKIHQKEAFGRYQLLRESQKLKIHDKVRLRNVKPLIRKESAVFFPHTSEKVYEIVNIKNKFLPYQYALGGLSKTYYGWNLVKVSPSILNINSTVSDKTTTPDEQNKPVITVQNILPKTDSTKLRNGKVLTHPFDMTYDILKDGERQFVDKETLQLYKRLFGSQILQYNEALLSDPEKNKHII